MIEEVEQSSDSSASSKQQHKYFREDDFEFNKSQDSNVVLEDNRNT